jgi:hypothetical protein
MDLSFTFVRRQRLFRPTTGKQGETGAVDVR